MYKANVAAPPAPARSARPRPAAARAARPCIIRRNVSY